jgi:2-dehydropantoate 2-reductase
MLQDFELGKRLELDTLNGALIEMGKKYDLPTPVNEQIVEMVNARIRESPVKKRAAPG